ncbi:MAG: hypothetical protein GY805_13765 [Chloroflexi bacterium]|nr:hypothetical protein [Chloroflexota bacterium]
MTILVTANKNKKWILMLLLTAVILAACSGGRHEEEPSLQGTPTPDDFEDENWISRPNNKSPYDLTSSNGIQAAYEDLSGERVEADDYCFAEVNGFTNVAIIGAFANDYGCIFEEAIVIDELGSLAEMTPLALQHNGWDDDANRAALAQTWAEEALLAAFSIVRSENDDFLRADSPPFAPPTVTQMENGRIQVEMWVREPSGMLPQNIYRHMQIIYAAEGELLTNNRGLQFAVEFDLDIELTPEPAPEPTATALPDTVIEATKIPQATAVPVVDGLRSGEPWIVMANFNGIFAANSDGSAITQLSEDLVAYGQNSLLAEISPDRQWLGYVTVEAERPILKVIELRSQNERTVTPLISDISVPPDAPFDCLGADGASDPCQAYYTVGPMAWSPNGRQLAFIGAHDGPTSDLYVYDLAEDQVRQLTNGPAHAANPIWSPDGQYIFHRGVSFAFGSGVAEVTAAWSARADGGGVVTLHGDPESTWETILGWQGDHTILIHSEAFPCAKNLRAINVATGVTTTLWEHTFGKDFLAYAPRAETLLFSDGSVAGCGDDDFENDGVFFMSPIDGSLTPLTAVSPFHVSPFFLEESLAAFYYETLDSWQLIFPDDAGKVFSPADVRLPDTVRLDGDYGWGVYTWHDQTSDPEGLWVYNRDNPDAGVQLVFAGDARDIQIPTGSQTILFFDAESPATLYVAEAPEFVPTPVTHSELRGRHWDTLVFWSPVPTN